MQKLQVVIDWHVLKSDADEGWQQCRCLYLYRTRLTREVLYIGKAWSTTVRGRWHPGAKREFWEDLRSERWVRNPRVYVGTLTLPSNSRLTHQLLCDVESLLISSLLPWGNIQSGNQRISRPGLVVKCRGPCWPIFGQTFHDPQLRNRVDTIFKRVFGSA
jgi:hypothetical protein